MDETVLLGRGKQMIAVPWQAWLGHLDEVAEHGQARLAFMTAEHHRVRYFVVERKLFFLWRDEAGAVAWAYPVTIDRTPHVIRFSSGERLHGA
jgi:hypothetical protein